MAYSKFTLESIEQKLGFSNTVARLFPKVTAMEPSDYLKKGLKIAEGLRLSSEKARSEAIVFPILVELRNRNDNFLTVFSGDNLNIDKARGLEGECDFIVSKDIGTFNINYPILSIVEAKKHDIEIGIPQCAAQMIGAKIFNERKGVNLDVIYGCVTTGKEWVFLKLEDKIIVDSHTYYLGDTAELLGAFQEIINYYKVLLGTNK